MEMKVTEEDSIVNALRSEPSFDEEFIRRRYKELIKEREFQKYKRDKLK